MNSVDSHHQSSIELGSVINREWDNVLRSYVNTKATLGVNLIEWLPDGRYVIYDDESMVLITGFTHGRSVKTLKGVLYYHGEEIECMMKWDRRAKGWCCDVPGEDVGSSFKLIAWVGKVLFFDNSLFDPKKMPRLYMFHRSWFDAEYNK